MWLLFQREESVALDKFVGVCVYKQNILGKVEVAKITFYCIPPVFEILLKLHNIFSNTISKCLTLKHLLLE